MSIEGLMPLTNSLEPLWPFLEREQKQLLRQVSSTLRRSADDLVTRVEVHGPEQIQMACDILGSTWASACTLEIQAEKEVRSLLGGSGPEAVAADAADAAVAATRALLEKQLPWTSLRLPWAYIRTDLSVLRCLDSSLQMLHIEGIGGGKVDLSPLLALHNLNDLRLSTARGQSNLLDMVSATNSPWLMNCIEISSGSLPRAASPTFPDSTLSHLAPFTCPSPACLPSALYLSPEDSLPLWEMHGAA